MIRPLLLSGVFQACTLFGTVAMAQPADAPPPVDEAWDEEGETIVVSAGRPKDAVLGDVPVEISLSPGDVRSYGVSTINELLAELAPQTTTGGGGTSPVVLLGGRRISGFREIRSIPTEAIARVDILPPEAALRYGYRNDQKVVNIVLRDNFRSVTAEADMRLPTAGGRSTVEFEAGLLRLTPAGRLNLELSYERSSALLESERALSGRAARRPYATGGNIGASQSGEAIDPAWSDAIVAGVPASAISGVVPGLADFSTTPNAADERAYRTLLPEAETFDANAVYATTLFDNRVEATVNAGLAINSSTSRQGLAGAEFLLPASSPWSPFGRDVTLYRHLEEYGPLAQENGSTDIHLGLNLGGDISGWRWSFTGNYDRARATTRTSTGPLLSEAEALIAGGEPGFNPYAPLDAGLIALTAIDRSRSLSNSGDAQLVASGPVMKLPAGDVTTSVTVKAAMLDFDSTSRRGGLETRADLSRDTIGGQTSIDVPLTSRRRDFARVAGDLSVNFNAAFDHLSDFGTLRTLGYGANWKPIPALGFIGSVSHTESAPSVQQLGNPLVTTTGVRVFDYVRGETVDISRISGGNPALLADDRRIIKLGANVQPFPGLNLTLVGDYQNTRFENPIMAFPTATAAIEAAFPDRFTRDAAGSLLAIDSRPINFSRRDQENIRWGVHFSHQIRSAATREGGEGTRASREGPPAGRGFGPGGARGGTRLQFSAYHSWHLQDRILMYAGGPELDLLRGDAIGSSGGQPRHTVEVRAGVTRNGLGLRLSGNWQAGTTVSGGSGGAAHDLRFSDLATLDLRLFADLGAQRDLVRKMPFLRGTRVTLAVDNIFDQRMSVRDALGNVPVSYQPAYLDPLGRSVRISIRKMFAPRPAPRSR